MGHHAEQQSADTGVASPHRIGDFYLRRSLPPDLPLRMQFRALRAEG